MRQGDFMEFITEKILNILETSDTTQLERMKLKLGLQVLCHNIWMTSVILILAWYMGLFQESFILFLSYGILKIHVGGVHFHKSWQCLTATTSFIIGGVLLAQHMTLQLELIVLLYILSILLLWIVGPQGTRNNPISESNYPILRRRSLYIVLFYLGLTVSGMLEQNTTDLLLIAVLFGTFSIVPNKIHNSHCSS